MRSTVSMLRLTTHAILLAFAGLLLVAFGCSGAQAQAGMQATATHAPTAHVSAAHVSAAHVSAAQFSPATDVSVAALTAPVSTACVPGRDKVRLERDALPPVPAHLQPAQQDTDAGLAERTKANSGAAQLLGRTPASLTHLDLGIVRT
ncbi:hypothetical protein [Arthrobacter sp. HLT1-20]